jgi:hypothetical protein
VRFTSHSAIFACEMTLPVALLVDPLGVSIASHQT